MIFINLCLNKMLSFLLRGRLYQTDAQAKRIKISINGYEGVESNPWPV
jgi:hypothetical protein